MAKKTEIIEIDIAAANAATRRAKKRVQNATARRHAAANRANGIERPHTQRGVNDGLTVRAKRDRDGQQALAAMRREQCDTALAMLPSLLPTTDEVASRVGVAVLLEFLVARRRTTPNGQYVSATMAAVSKVRVKLANVFRDEPAAAEAGLKAAKTALYRAANPDWEKADVERREARRSTPAKKPARRPYSDADIAELETAVGAASTNLRIAKAVNRRNVPAMMAELGKAKKALASAKAANERAEKATAA